MITLNISKLWKRAVSDSSHYLISSVFVKVLAILVIPVVTRLISVEEFAAYDLFLSASAISLVLLTLGMDSGIAILIAEQANNKNELAKLFKLNLSLSLMFYLILLVVFAPLIYFNVFDGITYKRGFYFALYTFSILTNYLILNFSRWIGRVKVAAYVGMVSNILGLVLGLSLLNFEANIDSYFLGLVCGACVGTVILLYTVRDYLWEPVKNIFAKEKLMEVLKLSLPFVPNYLCNSLMVMADRLVILTVLDTHTLGIYALLSRIASIPNMLINVVSSGFIPVLYKNYETDEGALFIKQILHTYFLLVPAAIAASVFVADDIVNILGGEKYLGNANYVPYMIASVLFVSSTQLSGFSYSIKRKTHIILYITFLSLVLNLLISYILALYLGLLGVVLGSVLVSLGRAVWYIFISERLYSFGYNWKIICLALSASVSLLIFGNF